MLSLRGAATEPSEPPRASLWTWAAVVSSALYALFVFLLPARGLTFLWDDWQILARTAREPWPASWLAPVNEHWKPLYVALIHCEHRLFGGNHTWFLATTFVLHVANVFLLARLLARRTGDERAAALGAAAFGLSAAYREVLWWACLGGLALSVTITLLGFLAFERARDDRRWLPAALACVLGAPLAFGSGLALGPALAIEALGDYSRARSSRARTAALVLVPWAVYLAVYFAVAPPLAPAAPSRALLFATDAVGLGVAGRNLLLPVPEDRFFGALLAGAYACVVGVLVLALPARPRRRLFEAQAFLLLIVGPIAVARSREPDIAAAWSRYQYFPALAWTTTLALALARGLGRARTVTLVASLAILGGQAFRHAKAAGADGRIYAPAQRRPVAALVGSLVEAAGAARGPVYNAPLPIGLAWPGTRAREAVEACAPGLHVEWTETATPESIAPLRSLLAPR